MPNQFRPPEHNEHPELFFALVGPCGADMNAVVTALEAALCIVDYRLDQGSKLSQLLHALKGYEELADFDGPEDERIKLHMDAGDRLRRSLGHGGAVAALAVNDVAARRDGANPRARTAYLFRSLKHHGEIELLRLIYESSLIVISIYEPESKRYKRLVQRMRQTGGSVGDAEGRARELMRRDLQGGGDDDLGQNVRKTFPKADFFLNAGTDLQAQTTRLVELLFGHPFRSPTRDEYAMFVATATALRSADLSRQVGAAVVRGASGEPADDGDGEVAAAGCNEVPKPGGGVYWGGDKPDLRDYSQGNDPNALMGQELLVEVLGSIKESGWLNEEVEKKTACELATDARAAQVFKNARISSLLEFGRVVHAEMNVLALAARRGIALEGARLYCTTFPCHVCARHLLAAGLSEVVYIEPYPKSLATELYPDAIVLGDARMRERLVFRSFIGVSPARYLEWFSFGKRKDDKGFAWQWNPRVAQPRMQRAGNPHLLVEADVCKTLFSALKARQLV